MDRTNYGTNTSRCRPIVRTLAAFALACAPAPCIAQQFIYTPVFGFAGLDNHHHARKTLIAEFDLEPGTSDAIVLAGPAEFTGAPAEVIAGARSVRLAGPTAMLEIDADTLALQAGAIYALEYDYRILDDAAALSALLIAARWGPDNTLYTDPWGLRPDVSPMQGTQRRQFRFGAGGNPTFLLTPGGPATVVVDNLRVWRLDAEAHPSRPPIFGFGFPRLGNYNYDSPHAGAVFNGVSAASIEDVLGRFDLVNGVQIDHTLGDTAWVDRIRARNPTIVIVPYRLSHSAQHLESAEPVGGASDLRALFNSSIPDGWVMRGPDGEPLRDQIFQGNTQLDTTEYCQRIDGLIFPEFMVRFLAESVLPSGLWNGIHFDQAEWFPNPLLAETINGPLPDFDIDRDGIADPLPMVFAEMRAAFDRYFYRVRERFGSSRILFGNPGRIPLDSSVVGMLNGWQQELLSPYQILESGDWDTSRAAHWHDFVRNYLNASVRTRAPQAINIQCTGMGLGQENGLTTGHGYPNRTTQLEARDFQRMRLGLTTTLLGNGFFGYDLVDNTTPPVWFDEYAIDAEGRPTTDLAGKGYLGQPLADAQEITRPGPVLLSATFEGDIPPGLVLGQQTFTATDPWQVIEGSASLGVTSAAADDFLAFMTDPAIVAMTPGTSYDFSAKFRVLDYHPESFDGLFTMGIAIPPIGYDFHACSYAYHQDIEGAGQTITMRTQVRVQSEGAVAYALLPDLGTISIDEVRIAEVAGGAFRRDFEGGIALVNPTPETITLSLAEIAGPMQRTGLRRIAGTQDPGVNSGLPVTDSLTIPPADGIILLADRLPAPPPISPTYVVATPGAAQPVIDLVWNTPTGGTRAGHLIEFKLADTDHWDRFELEGPGNFHRLEFLDPGTAFDIRIAAFDFAGRISDFSDPIRATTAGDPPVRPRIEAIDRMDRGAFATVWGEDFADTITDLSPAFPYESGGVSVRINGEPTRLAFVSPWAITFLVPDTVAFGDASVRIIRDSVGSGAVFAQVHAPATPSPCIGDANDDARTDAADFIVLAGSYGAPVPPGTPGDFNADGIVNAADFTILAGNFGCAP